MANKAIITAAITGGIHIPTQTEYLPITPKQIIDETVLAYEAGAAVAHIHVRDPQDGRPISDLDLFHEVSASIKQRCNIILCITSGGNPAMTLEERISPVSKLQPELASCNSGSINFSLHPLADKFKEFKYEWEKPYLEASEDRIFPNTFKSIAYYTQTMYECGTVPEFEVYDVGHLNNLAFLISQGKIKKPVYLQFVMGILGGIPATISNLNYLVETATRTIGDFNWSACCAGKDQMTIGTVALAMGGNARVGLEDNVWLEKGVKAKSNAEQVAKIVRIARELSVEIATPDEARKILGLKGMDKVNY